MLSRFFCCLLLFLSFFLLAQPPKKKKMEMKEEKYDRKSAPASSAPSFKTSSNATSLIQQAELLKASNPSLAIEKIEEALRLSIESGNKTQEAKCYQVLGAVNLSSNLRQLAISNSKKALALYTEVTNEKEVNTTRFQLAEALYADNQLDEALTHYQQHLNYSENTKNTSDATKSKFRIAEIQAKKGSKGKAIESYEEILQDESVNKNEEAVSEANKRIGEIYQSQKQNKRALEYYKQAQNSAEKEQDVEKVSKLNENISSVLKDDKNYDEELTLRKKSLKISKESKNPEVENKENIAIGNTYLDMKQSAAAIPYLERSITISDKLGKMEEKGEALKSLSEAYRQQKKFDQAMQSFQRYLAIKDTLLSQKEREIDQMLNTNLVLTQKQKKIDLLEKDVEINKQTINSLTQEKIAKEERLGRQLTIIYSLAVGIFIIVGASYLVYKSAQKRRIANQLLALKSLRSQMNPHFIFNALNSVNAFISKNDERSANKYLADFSKLMRMVMENSQHDFVPLSQEISILELYLSLEHFRFKEKFEYTFSVDEAIDTDAFEIPPMLIQPYIENAVWHGLRYKEAKGQLTVKIKKGLESGLSITIQDNGIGRKKSAELKTINQKSTHSTGIKNTANRITLINELYHKNIQLHISDLESSHENSGTQVILHLPK